MTKPPKTTPLDLLRAKKAEADAAIKTKETEEALHAQKLVEIFKPIAEFIDSVKHREVYCTKKCRKVELVAQVCEVYAHGKLTSCSDTKNEKEYAGLLYGISFYSRGDGYSWIATDRAAGGSLTIEYKTCPLGDIKYLSVSQAIDSLADWMLSSELDLS